MITGNRGFNEFDSVSKSYYVQDTVEFMPHWKLMLGARRDHLDADYLSSVGATAANLARELKFKEDSYRTGLSWQPTASTHYYVTYTDSFSPTADLYQLTAVLNRSRQNAVKLQKLAPNGCFWMVI